jgi:lipid-A-disaccharide synthase
VTPLSVYIVAGETSGDALAAGIMRALRAATGGAATFRGIGGEAMAGEGLKTLFPASEIALMGPLAILRRLPAVLRRLDQATRDVLAAPPDILLVIDSPEFTQRLAKRVRKAAPGVVNVKYVAPQAWAWRKGRVPGMRRHLDEILAILPFEPAFYEAHHGPHTTYVGHPLIEALPVLRPSAAEEAVRADAARPRLLVLPGSRVNEIERLMPVFGETLARLAAAHPGLDPVLPVVPHLATRISAAMERWPVKARLVLGADEKWAAFRSARAALAASGTVTLELGLASVPMVVAYKIDPVFVPIAKRLVDHSRIALVNIVLDRDVVPERLQHLATPEELARLLSPLLADGPERAAQLAAFARLDEMMALPRGEAPSARAARAVLEAYERVTGRAAPGAGTMSGA